MKVHLSRLLAGLAVFTFVSLGSFGLAQESPAKEQPAVEKKQLPTAEKKDLPIPELVASEVNPESIRPVVPPECAKFAKLEVQTHSGHSAGTLSPALASFLSRNNLPHKGYGDPRIDTAFADSFKLRCCKVCYATLEVVVKHGPGVFQPGARNFSNDAITVGVAPFSGSTPPTRFVSVRIWAAAIPNPKTLTYVLGPAAAWDKIDCTARPPSPYLDVYVQDDTEVDSVTLKVWYF